MKNTALLLMKNGSIEEVDTEDKLFSRIRSGKVVIVLLQILYDGILPQYIPLSPNRLFYFDRFKIEYSMSITMEDDCYEDSIVPDINIFSRDVKIESSDIDHFFTSIQSLVRMSSAKNKLLAYENMDICIDIPKFNIKLYDNGSIIYNKTLNVSDEKNDPIIYYGDTDGGILKNLSDIYQDMLYGKYHDLAYQFWSSSNLFLNIVGDSWEMTSDIPYVPNDDMMVGMFLYNFDTIVFVPQDMAHVMQETALHSSTIIYDIDNDVKLDYDDIANMEFPEPYDGAGITSSYDFYYNKGEILEYLCYSSYIRTYQICMHKALWDGNFRYVEKAIVRIGDEKQVVFIKYDEDDLKINTQILKLFDRRGYYNV